jgi:hypothetical protein
MSTQTNNAFILSGSTLTITTGGNIYIIYKSDSSFPEVMEALSEERWEDIPVLIDRAKAVEVYGEGSFQVIGNQIYIDGETLPHLLTNKILEFMREGYPYKPLLRFWNRLKKNPSYRAVKELYGFLEAANIPIMDDGRILCYKVVSPIVRNNKPDPKVRVLGTSMKTYMDIHSKSVYQGLQDIVEMDRNQVNEDAEQTCSFGLHACSWNYTNQFGSAHGGNDVVIEVAICPSDVIAIPKDYQNTKLRTCRYEILGENTELTERRQAYAPLNDYEYEDDDIDDDWEEEEEDEYLEPVEEKDLSGDYWF